MRVKIVAFTMFLEHNAKEFGYVSQWDRSGIDDLDPQDEQAWWDLEARMPQAMDELAEFAGRNCYQSWERPNPATAENKDYLQNILNQEHYSVLEHASATIAVDGVSTSMLGQLSRHRHLSFSVLSKRYVDESEANLVIHPGVEDYLNESVYPADYEYPYSIGEVLADAMDGAKESYELVVNKLIELGLPRKRAREIARGVLPQATETRIVVSGNLRAWRDFLGKRLGEGADEEIKAFAKAVLSELKKVAPNSFQDFEETE